MIALKDYQSEAVERLLNETENLLKTSESEVCILQAPTGSGKTIIVAEFLKRLIADKEYRKLSFIWISTRRLHDQSKEKLEKYYEHDRLLTCSYFEDLEDNKIQENEILFINWQSINRKDKNIFVRENEKDNNLTSIIRNTKEETRDIVLVIDESHHTASSEKSKELIEIISPKVTLEVSATPHLKEEISAFIKINLAAVKEEQMIKSEIAVNPEFKKIKIGSQDADELVIEQALKKREELKDMFSKEKSNVNPLVLIQLPDKKEGLDDKMNRVKEILNRLNVTEKNGKLAIWLSEAKSENLPNIEKNNNEVNVLMFKQAIALGWDCPRASILVVFRESKSFDFTIQTIGRIMRMPELKYYTKEAELNKGFVFTNLELIKITEDYVKDYVTVYESKRKSDLYDNLSLKSIHLKRQRQRTRLSGDFAKIFVELSKSSGLKDKIKLKPSKISNSIIVDGRIINIDKTGEILGKGTIDIALTKSELQSRFDKFIISNCSPFAPKDSSDRIKTALYQFLNKECKIEKYESQAQKIVLGEENVQLFADCILLSKEEYKKRVVEQLSEKREIEINDQWEVPIVIAYSSRYAQRPYNKSIMQPLYVRNPSEPETQFMERLAQSKKVKWWFKNGESESKYFAIYYEDENGFPSAFYVDFIVKFNDGTIGLFDTKKGGTTESAGPRAEGLQEYIKEQDKKGIKLKGGIVIFIDGSVRFNKSLKYSYNPRDLGKDWEILEI